MGHALYVGGSHVVDHLAVVAVEVGVIVELVPDDVAPVIVGDGGLGILFDEVLLSIAHLCKSAKAD